MSRLLIFLGLLLALLHHDFWLWDSTDLVLGFLPAGLAYHMLFSLAAALLAILAIKYAWPLEQDADSEKQL